MYFNFKLLVFDFCLRKVAIPVFFSPRNKVKVSLFSFIFFSEF